MKDLFLGLLLLAAMLITGWYLGKKDSEVKCLAFYTVAPLDETRNIVKPAGVCNCSFTYEDGPFNLATCEMENIARVKEEGDV